MSKLSTPASPRLSSELIRTVHQQGYLALEQLVTNATSTYQTAAAGAHFLLVVNYGNVAMLQWLLIKGPALNQQDSNG